MKINQKVLDKCGVILSVGCLIHCVLLPIILPLLPLLGFVVGHDGKFHLFLSAIIVSTAVMALIPGYLKHKRALPLFFGFWGVSFILVGGVAELFDKDNFNTIIPTMIGSCFMVGSHYLNHRFSCLCSHHNHKTG